MGERSSRSELAVLDTRWLDGAERRIFQRVPVDASAVLISTALGRVRATVSDLSQTGCRIRTRARCHAGDHYVLRLDVTGPRSVKVAWVYGEEVGLEFSIPLGWSIVSEIAFGKPLF